MNTTHDKRGDDEAVGVACLPINYHENFAVLHAEDGQLFALTALQDPFDVFDCVQNLLTQAGQFTMLFHDVRPSFVGQTNRYALARSRRSVQSELLWSLKSAEIVPLDRQNVERTGSFISPPPDMDYGIDDRSAASAEINAAPQSVET